MSFYELPAEGRGYYLFENRDCWKHEDALAHFHSAVEFLFVKEGRQEVVLDGEKRLLASGDVCFVDSFCVHSYTAAPDTVSYVLLGDRAYFEEFFLGRPGFTLPRFFNFCDFALLENLYLLCKHSYRNGEDARLVFSGAVRVLLGVIADRAGLAERKDDKQEILVCEILRYAQNNLAADLSLASLSSRYGYSREHLSRILHRYLSENWNDYVNRLRVERASRLLTERGDRNVLEILYECGFNSPNTFYRAYKKKFSACPRRNN